MDETTANVIAFLFVLVWAILIGRRIWLKKTKSRLENDVPKDVRQLIEPAREIQQKYRTPNPSDLLNVWGRISLQVISLHFPRRKLRLSIYRLNLTGSSYMVPRAT